MRFIYLSIVCLLIGSCQGAQNSELKSGYPDTYPIFSDKQTLRNIEVERIAQRDGGIGISVYYKGELRKTPNNSLIALYVKINYPDGSSVSDFLDAESDNGAVTRFYLSNTCIQGNYGGCAKHAGTSLKHLLNPFVQKNFGSMGSTLLALDIEFAFVTEDGRWDSLFGQNYHFTFSELQQ